MSRIMIVAGGAWQCPIVKKAKSMGHYVLCSNMFEDSPAFAFSDEFKVADVLDKEKNLNIAKEFKPDAILTDQTDIAVPIVAYLTNQLGLKGIGEDVAQRFTNKFYMREYASKAGILVPKYKLCKTIDEADDFLRSSSIGIIKPIDSQSSRGIHIVKSRSDLENYFDDCVQYSNAEKAILIEEYIDGTEFTVDGLKTSSNYFVTAISEKSHYEYNPNVANRLLFSNNNSRFDYDELRNINTKLIEAMGLPFGLTHTEYKYFNGNFYLIETAARGGGTKISSDITKLVSGIDTNRVLINILTEKSEEIIVDKHHECAILGFFDFKPGKVKDIVGLKEASSMEGVYEVKIEVEIGEILNKAQDDRSRCGYYIVYADSMDELNDRERRLKETVRVITE